MLIITFNPDKSTLNNHQSKDTNKNIIQLYYFVIYLIELYDKCDNYNKVDLKELPSELINYSYNDIGCPELTNF